MKLQHEHLVKFYTNISVASGATLRTHMSISLLATSFVDSGDKATIVFVRKIRIKGIRGFDNIVR